jgi:hypothetical protein
MHGKQSGIRVARGFMRRTDLNGRAARFVTELV